jgi:hypothetical protein
LRTGEKRTPLKETKNLERYADPPALVTARIFRQRVRCSNGAARDFGPNDEVPLADVLKSAVAANASDGNLKKNQEFDSGYSKCDIEVGS